MSMQCRRVELELKQLYLSNILYRFPHQSISKNQPDNYKHLV